ncbi:hypothetical protein CDD83_6141 [Cordyceps sp. RAO-2017]|nr:hypothetical protein CDD83_6141 [Cordyceps sp. RAO-2017]
MEDYKNRAVDMPDEPPKKAPTFTRDQILAGGQAPSGNLVRSRTTLGLPSQQRSAGGESSSFSDRSWQDTAATSAEGGEEAASFEPYSCFHLSQRILPHRVLARHVSGMKSLSVKELLKEVKSPDYSLPEVEQDIVVFAIMAKKSEPRAHKASAAAKKGSEAEERGKYMVMTLVDLDFELELFLFNSGFTRFWKVTEGTVVAILNPSVMPPPPGRQDTGRFSLVINSDADTILEIGSARDLGFCQSVKKDGSACGAWVNKKRTQFCEFHSNEAIRKQRSARVEFNSSGFGGWERRPKRGGGSGGGREWQGGGRKGGPDNYDRETKTSWFASRSYSSADLIDGKDRAPADKKERSEFLKRSLEAKEKEREMMKKLGRVGSAAGREYMQRAEQTMMTGGGGHGEGNAGGSATSQAVAAGGNEHRASEVAKPGAISLGLQRGKGRAIHLSPIKRKRPESSQAGSSAGNSNSRHSSRATTGYGWGSSLKDKLSRMKEGQATGQRGGSKSPVRKKTRFVTDKGIREAGRESLGLDLPERQAAAATAGSSHGQADDEDDELIIVK